MSKSKKAVATVVGIISVLLAAGAVVFAFRDKLGFSDVPYYMEFNGRRLERADNAGLSYESVNRFDVKYEFSFWDKKDKAYDVKIIPNGDFSFTVDGEAHNFSAETDLTPAFELYVYEDFFILDVPKNMTVKTVLESIYTGAEITVPETVTGDNFTMLVTSPNNGTVYRIDFGLYSAVESLTLDKGNLIF